VKKQIKQIAFALAILTAAPYTWSAASKRTSLEDFKFVLKKDIKNRNDALAVLQLPQHASKKDATAQYRQLARIMHPDKHDESNQDIATKILQKINLAYEILTAETQEGYEEAPEKESRKETPDDVFRHYFYDENDTNPYYRAGKSSQQVDRGSMKNMHSRLMFEEPLPSALKNLIYNTMSAIEGNKGLNKPASATTAIEKIDELRDYLIPSGWLSYFTKKNITGDEIKTVIRVLYDEYLYIVQEKAQEKKDEKSWGPVQDALYDLIVRTLYPLLKEIYPDIALKLEDQITKLHNKHYEHLDTHEMMEDFFIFDKDKEIN